MTLNGGISTRKNYYDKIWERSKNYSVHVYSKITFLGHSQAIEECEQHKLKYMCRIQASASAKTPWKNQATNILHNYRYIK